MTRSILCTALALAACRATSPAPAGPALEPAPPQPPQVGREMVVCGERILVGAPVVLWTDPAGYDATSTRLAFAAPAGSETPADGTLRYQPGRVERDGIPRVLVPPGSTDRAALAQVVDQVVLHYDACGLARTCFEVLHDRRGLSAHFLLDLDGTIYQTLDLREQAWHATKANVRSIGIEIANVGAYPPGNAEPLERWYTRDGRGTRIVLPEGESSGLRTRGYVGRPLLDERVRGTINGGLYEMHDLTGEQYDSLVKLTAALCRTFPRILPDAPRRADGTIPAEVLSDAEYEAFRGVLGHYHVQRNKVDPGPAFQWEPFLARVRTRLAILAP